MIEKNIVAKIHEDDPNFSKTEFKQWCNQVLGKLQEAWSKKDLETLKYYEAKTLYELHKKQLNVMKERKIINVAKEMEFLETKIIDFERLSDCEVITVEMLVNLIDYYQEEGNGIILSGKIDQKIGANYRLKISRDKYFLTEWLVNNSSVCYFCGAPINDILQIKCEYCNSVLKTMDNCYKIISLQI